MIIIIIIIIFIIIIIDIMNKASNAQGWGLINTESYDICRYLSGHPKIPNQEAVPQLRCDAALCQLANGSAAFIWKLQSY